MTTRTRRRRGHVPVRRCLGCRERRPKAALARFVAPPRPEGRQLSRDADGTAGGRGLYVCLRPACFERAVARRAFQRALRPPGPLAIDPALGSTLLSERKAGQWPVPEVAG